MPPSLLFRPARIRSVRGLVASTVVLAALASSLPSSGADLLAYFEFNDPSDPLTTTDTVGGHDGDLISGAAYTADGEGRTGAAGDRGMDFGFDTAAQAVHVTDATFLNETAVGDEITITFWQKNNGTASSSTFWGVSPGSSGSSRGIQAHVPWGGGTIFFDHGGCCAAPTQRLNGTPPPEHDWLEWHHYVFLKAGDRKEVWIDGVLILSGTGAGPLPADFTELYIGSTIDGASVQAVVDDFAVFSGALVESEIQLLAEGASALALVDDSDTDGDGMPDVWEELYGLNPSVNDAAEDEDNDGLTNLQEFEKKTNPIEADTDGDGLNDGVETDTGTWVSTDNTGTSPRDSDSDNDTLSDGVENPDEPFVDASQPGTDPNKVDTDGDSYNDNVELAEGTDPTNPANFPLLPIDLGVGTAFLLGGDLTDPEDDGDPEADFGYNAIFDSNEEQGFGGGEFAFNVFDNVVGGGNEKWCCGNDPGFPYWVQATFEEPIVLTHFTIASANDTPDRDPRIWEIQGSNDGTNFETIYRRDDPTASIWGTVRLSVKRLNAGMHYPVPPAYTTIRFVCEATGLAGGARFQIGELEFFGEVGALALFEITSIQYNAGDDEFTLIWNSRPGKTYTLFATPDLKIPLELDDAIPSEGAETSYTFGNPSPGADNQFFYIQENE